MSQKEPKLKIVHTDRINLTWRDEQYHVDIPGSDVPGKEYVRADKYDALEALLAPLKEIAGRMRGQDNRATGHPIFIVQQKRRIWGMDFEYGDEQVWLYDGVEVAKTQEDLERFLCENELDEDECMDKGGLREVRYTDTFEFVQSFFSNKAAVAYIKVNRHNLTDPRVYVDSAHRNTEWQAIRSVLLGISVYSDEEAFKRDAQTK